MSCLGASRHHLLSGSDDSNVHVWSLARLLALDAEADLEPARTLSHHRAAVTALAVGPGAHPDTSLCVSASRDKTCILWNYQTGVALRTLLFPTFPLCVCLDAAARVLCLSMSDGAIYLVELFGEKPLLGSRSGEVTSTVVQIAAPFGVAPSDAGPAACLALSYDGTVLLSGHPRGQVLQWSLSDNSLPVELANLNAAVTNLQFVSPFSAAAQPSLRVQTVVKPSQADRKYTITAQFASDLAAETRLRPMLELAGFPQDVLEHAISSLHQPSAGSAGDHELQRQNEELLEIVDEQQALYKQTLHRYAEARAGRP